MKRLLLLLVVVTVVIGLAGCDLLGKKEILYQVEHTVGFGSVDIRYENEDGDLEEIYGATAPWSYSFTINRVASAIVAYVSAENNQGSGTVTVRILEDGSQVDIGQAVYPVLLAEAAAVIE